MRPYPCLSAKRNCSGVSDKAAAEHGLKYAPILRRNLGPPGDEIYRRLDPGGGSFDPYAVGESQDGNRRILIVWPLALSYVVKEDDRIVQINKIWRYDV